MTPEELKAKIEAVNSANAYANELVPKLVEIFTPLIGQQIIKNDGTLLSKIAILIPEFTNTFRLSVYSSISHYTLAWTVKTCIPYGHTCEYHETYVYVGSISSKALNNVNSNFVPLRCDYTVNEIVELQKKAVEAKKAYDDIKSSLGEFQKGV